jgi:aryl-alcohol dehydrogenase-like predicted oxidoreductase
VRYRELGAMTVSTIGLGSWLTYGGGVAKDRAQACTRAAIDAGITFFDTANVYGRGAAERVWGEILSEYPRDSYVLATKAYFAMSKTDRGLSKEQIHKQLDASLKRLNVDYVDLFQCHRYDNDTPLEETMAGLTEVVQAGKARHVGFSEWPIARIEQALALPHVTRFASSQPQYSALHREPEHELFPLCKRHGIGQIVWSPLAQGVLTGKYSADQPPPDDTRATDPQMRRFIGQYLRRDTLERVQRFVAVAQQSGHEPAQLALAWVLDNDFVASAITGASRPEQLVANAKASAIDLDAGTRAAIDAALAPAQTTLF